MIIKKDFSIKNANIKRTLKIMRTFILFFAISLSMCYASTSYSQTTKLSLSLKNKSLSEVFNTIENKSEYIFLYNSKVLDTHRKVSVNVTNQTIDQILDDLFSGTNNVYKISDRNILISSKAETKTKETLQATENVTVEGKVTDKRTGETLIGVTVLVKNKPTLATMTDMDGYYKLTVPENSTLVFQYIGYSKQEIVLKNQKQQVVDIILSEDDVMLQDVVVTALGIKRETKALGYAVAEVKSDALTAGREDNVMAALSGKVAGVDIASTSAGPSGSTRVLIRGNSQLSGSNLPLYVIDGVPMDNTQLGQADKWGGYDFGDGLSSINPEDIESVSVLKGASASALYGSRASNGVILITTKSGKGKKGIGIEFSSNVSIVSTLSKFDDYQREYGQGRNGVPPFTASDAASTTAQAWGAKLDPNMNTLIYNGQYKPYGNVENNVLSFLRTGSTFTNSISLNGGGEKATFRASVSDMRNNDIVPNSNMARTTFMLRGEAKLGNNLTVEGRVNYSLEKVKNRPALSDSPNNVGLSVIGLAPNFDQRWLNEGYKDEYGRYVDWNGGNIYRINPYWSINEMSNVSHKNRLMGHLQLNYQITPKINVQGKVGTDTYEFKITDFVPVTTPYATQGQMSESLVNVYEHNFEGLVRYTDKFDKLDVSAFVGGNIRMNRSKSFINTGVGEVITDLRSILNYTNYSLTHTYYRKQVNSLYGAVNLGWDNFAYLDFTIRNDISSSLHRDNRSYIYPSVSGSFVFSSLFDLSNTPISFGKVRASWAKVGGDTDPYMLDLNYGLLSYTLNGTPLGQIQSTVVPNKLLKPTSTYSYEFGTDIRLWQDRLNFDFGYYHQSTIDQILNLPTSLATGYGAAIINAGEIINKGIEVAVTAVPVRTKDFEWSTTINLAKNTNEIVSLHEEVADYELSAARWANAYIYATEGQPYGVIVGRAFNRSPEGDVIFKNGMPTYTEELKILGNGTYDFTLGWGHSFSYKGISMSALFDMKWGADIYSMSSLMSHQNGTSKATLDGRAGWYQSEEARKAGNVDSKLWTPTGGYVGQGVVNVGTAENPVYEPNTVMVDPQAYWRSVTDNTAEPFIYDASFIKLRELNISYSLPSKLLTNTPFEAVSFSAYGRNLFTIYSKVKNIDPESNYNSSNGQGFEYGSLPSRRTFGFGINVKF